MGHACRRDTGSGVHVRLGIQDMDAEDRRGCASGGGCVCSSRCLVNARRLRNSSLAAGNSSRHLIHGESPFSKINNRKAAFSTDQ